MQSKFLILLVALALMAPVAVAQKGLITGSTVGLDPITANNGHLGCVELGGRIFITSRGLGSAPPHLIYEFDCTGALIATYDQSAASSAGSAWGYRDGCVGTHPQSSSPGMAALYFGYEGGVEVIDPATLVPPGGPGAITPLATFSNVTVGIFRGMAWDPTGDGGAGSIWTSNFGSPLWEVSATAGGTAGAPGTLITTYPLPAPPNDWSTYGLAYDSVTGNLWVNSAPGTNSLIAEIDITSATPGVLTGVAMARAAPGTAQGGLSPLSPGSPCQPPGSGLGGIVMIGLDQATPDAYSLYDTAPTAALTTGVGGGPQIQGQTPVLLGAPVLALDWSVISLPAGALTGPAITIMNIGTVGAPPAATFNFTGPGIQLGNWTLAMEPPFTTPASGPANPSLGIADGVTLGLLLAPPPALTTVSIHGLFPMDLIVGDPTPASIVIPPIFPAGTALYMQTIYVDSGGTFRATNVAGWDFLTCSSTENFDTLATGPNAPPGWTNPSGGAVAWTVQSGPTTSGLTGPAGANSPPNYFYCETSVPNSPGVLFQFDTCHVDVSSLSAFTLDFQLTRVGATIGTLNIFQDDGSGTFPTLIATYTGPGPVGVDWTAESVPFTPLGTGVAFRFSYTSGSSFTGDLGIDDLNVL